jgi:hypothetical protein
LGAASTPRRRIVTVLQKPATPQNGAQFSAPPSVEELADDDILEVDGEPVAPPVAVEVIGAPEPAKAAVPPPPKTDPSPVVEAVSLVMKPSNDPKPADEPKETVIVVDEGVSEPRADRTLKLARADVFTAASVLAAADGAPQVHVPPAPTTAPVLPHAGPSAPPASRMPSVASIPPVAIDVAHATGSIIHPPASGAPHAAPVVAMPARKSPMGWIALGVAAALVLGVGGVAAGFAIGSSGAPASAGGAPDAPAAAAKVAHKPVVEGANTASIDTTPATAPVRAPIVQSGSTPSEIDVSALPTATSPHARTSSVARDPSVAAPKPKATIAPAPAPSPSAPSKEASPPPAETAAAPAPPTPAPVAAAPAPVPTTGVVRVPIDDRIVTIVVDGGYRKVKNGMVVVSCGKHSIRLGGLSTAQDVVVPCGGSISLQ